jgi:glycerol-3-phosphate acyltransferase PlsY
MTGKAILLMVVLPLVGYVIGATPFGVLIARGRGVNLRKVGSGNVGATNVGRALGRKWGYVCFFLDVAKGLAPTLITGVLLRREGDFPTLTHQLIWLGVGFGAIAGHVFSFYLKFRGGKGVATSMGVVLGIFPYFTYPGLCALGVWIGVTLFSRYVSLGSVAAAVSFVPLFVAFRRGQVAALWPLCAFAGAMVGLIIIRHRGNIVRLLSGTENKIGESKGELETASIPPPVPSDDGEQG